MADARPVATVEATAWLTPCALAEREGISRTTVWRWVEKGLVEVKRLEARTGVRVRLKEDDAR